MSSPINIENNLKHTNDKNISQDLPIHLDLEPLKSQNTPSNNLVNPITEKNLPVYSDIQPINNFNTPQNINQNTQMNTNLQPSNNQISPPITPTYKNTTTNENTINKENIINEEKIISIVNTLLKNIKIEEKNEIIQNLNKNNKTEESKTKSTEETKSIKTEKNMPVTTYNFNKNLWYISLSSTVLTFLIIILLVLKWKDNDY
jgi:hypothetical protein